jgi:hypothetical protein
MTRVLSLSIGVLAMFWTAVATADDVIVRHAIYLNRPNALEVLQQTNPMHYEKVQRIMEGLVRRPENDVPRWIQTDFNGWDIRYVAMVLTSAPPKKRLSFVLDDTRYSATVTLTDMRGEIIAENW